MKKAFLFLLLNFLLSNFAIAQLKRISEFQPISERMVQDFKNELKFTTKTDELRASKVDFIAFKKYHIGAYRQSLANDSNGCKNCYDDYPIYLIWKENNKSYIQRFDNCGVFNSIKLKNNQLFDEFLQNFDTIKEEKVKVYQEKENTVTTISHSSFMKFIFSKDGKEHFQYIDEFNLDSQGVRLNIKLTITV